MSTWKGSDKPGGASFVTRSVGNASLPDCPKCKFGTLTVRETIYCIDCKQEFTLAELEKLGVKNLRALKH